MQLICGVIVSIFYFCYIVWFSNDKLLSLVFYIYILGEILDINWFFFGLEEFRLTVIRNSIIKVISTSAIFVFVKNKNDVLIYSLIISLSVFFSQLWLWFLLRKRVSFIRPSLNEIKKHIKPNLILFITVILVSLFKIMDKVMLGVLSNYDEVGFYESSEKIIAVPVALISALGTVMLPRSTNLIANRQENEAKTYIYNSIVYAMFISTSICFGIMGVTKEFIPFFYGTGYEKCISVYLVLLPSSIFLAFANVIRTQYLLPKKMDKSYIVSAAIGAIVNIVLNLFLITPLGSVGAAIGTLFAELSVCIYQVMAVRLELPIGRYIYSSVPFAFVGLVMFVVLFNISIQSDNMIYCLIIKIIVGFITYIVLLIIALIIIKQTKNMEIIDLKNFKKTIMDHKE